MYLPLDFQGYVFQLLFLFKIRFLMWLQLVEASRTLLAGHSRMKFSLHNFQSRSNSVHCLTLLETNYKQKVSIF